jgi:hypothetical protein
VFFGIYALVKGKLQTSRKSTTLILVLIILYLGQLVSTKILGQPFIPQSTLSTLVLALVIWIFWMVRDGKLSCKIGRVGQRFLFRRSGCHILVVFKGADFDFL